MSKALKAYSSTYAREPAQIAKFFAEMKSDSARGAVAAISALIEEQLASAIKSKLVPLTQEDEQQLFSSSGPFATLSARINIGYALGMFGKRAKRDLNLVREIRNAFVHSIRHIDFETSEVKDLCGKFYCAEAIPDFEKQTPRAQFFEAAMRVLMHATREIFDADYSGPIGIYAEYQLDNEELIKKGVKLRPWEHSWTGDGQTESH